MDLNFRTLCANEIEVRVGQVNKGGAALLLYKDARCDMNILDEKVGPLNWRRSHSRDNANCTVEIYDCDKKEWVGKEDTGEESNVAAAKGLASDSFKRSCYNWGIGRELYTASELNIFYPAANLKAYTYDETKRKGSCGDTFKVSEIQYEEKIIRSIVIDAYLYGKKHGSMKFTNPRFVQSETTKQQTAPVNNSQANAARSFTNTSQKKPPSQAPAQTKPPQQTNDEKTVAPNKLFEDDEVILIGNCRGLKFSVAKNSDTFKSFLSWVKGSSASYKDPKQAAQFEKFKVLANSIIK